MRYQHFRSRGLFVGSGADEAGCKAVIGQRPKPSGMRWTVSGADATIALRCREASSQWGNHLPHAAQPDSSRLTSPHPKMTYTTSNIGAHSRRRIYRNPGNSTSVAGGTTPDPRMVASL